ncbi:hypothetical protein [Actinocrispum sp. NPDC049592]|uniref:hypothetical protein n=1 Tax=Actinocrispum sp. NPDC049592 TaxID=3154835 RepID=UPI0034139205
MTPVRIAAGIAALVILGGCSSPAAPEQKVATLQTSSAAAPPAAPPSAPAEAARPRLRLDMTPDEEDQLYTAYSNCMADHGFRKGPGMDMSKEAAATAACKFKDPLPPWEYDTANPQAADFAHKMVLCLRGKGVKYVEESPVKPGDERTSIALGGAQNDSDSISKGLNLIPQCEKELSAGGNK